MSATHRCYAPDDPLASNCYVRAIRTLSNARVGFLVGGAYALARHTGIARPTKDFDIFLRPEDRDRALAAFDAAGYRTEVTYTHWLAKAYHGEFFIDLVYGSGNASGTVDDGWFAHATDSELFGEPVKVCPPEEAIWSKAFIMERNRYDGADVAHILLALGDRLNWPRLLDRFGPNWRVLYSHLVLFGFVYPAERDRVPDWVVRELTYRFQDDLNAPPPADRVCQGTLLAATQYIPDVERWGYSDARVAPYGPLTPEQVAVWTEGVLSGR